MGASYPSHLSVFAYIYIFIYMHPPYLYIYVYTLEPQWEPWEPGAPLREPVWGLLGSPWRAAERCSHKLIRPRLMSPRGSAVCKGAPQLGAPLGSHPPLGKGAPQLGAPLQVGRQRWTCGALWLSPSHQLTESMLQTGASCRTAPPLCAGGAATQKQGAPPLRAPCRDSAGGLRSRRC